MAEASATLDLADRTREADHPHSLLVRFPANNPLRLDLKPFQIAYQTYGELMLPSVQRHSGLPCADRRPACRQCHPVTGKPGWWETMVGPGRPLDTDSYFIICPNVIGGCMGSTGPASTNPETGKLWGLDFPIITDSRHGARAGDAARPLSASTRCSAWSAARWAACRRCNGPRPIRQRVFSALAIACSTRHSAQNIAFHELGRQAVMADPDWRGGRYFRRHPSASRPRRGADGRAYHLSVGRRPAPQVRPADAGPRPADVLVRRGFPGRKLSALPGLVLCRALRRQQLSLSDPGDGLFRHRRRSSRRAGQAFRGIQTRFCVVSFTSDWLFPTSESRAIVHALNASGARVSFAEIETDRGHDAFLLDVPEFFDISRAFLQSAGKARGLTKGRRLT
jgi:homoserine O-acetyltransferase